MKASKPQRVRQDNLVFLKKIMKENGALSQREIASLTGLSVVTINKLIPELLAAEIIVEASQSVATGGRRAISYEYNGQHHMLLVIQLIEEERQFFINFHMCDLYGTIVLQEKRMGNSLSWAGMKDVIGELVKQFPQTAGVILGIPGVEKNGVSQMIDYPPLKNVRLREEIKAAFDLPVMIENDINAAVFGCGTLRGISHDTLIGLYYPNEFPPGAGILLNGQLIKGRNGFAGEVKYLPLRAFNQWDQVSVELIDIQTNLREVVQSMICLYDPDEIVVYTNNQRLQDADLKATQQKLSQAFPELVLPKMSLSTEFNRDYLQGLIAQGIGMIEAKDVKEMKDEN